LKFLHEFFRVDVDHSNLQCEVLFNDIPINIAKVKFFFLILVSNWATKNMVVIVGRRPVRLSVRFARPLEVSPVRYSQHKVDFMKTEK